MKFSSCCFATFLVCLVSFHQSSSFRLHHGKPKQNEINELLPGRYFIQNVATGLVIGAIYRGNFTGNGYNFNSTMESLEEATTDPEQKSTVLWEVDRQSTYSYTRFHSVGPDNSSNLEMEPFCVILVCIEMGVNWNLVSRGPDIWQIRQGYLLWTPVVSNTCLTGYGLHKGIERASCTMDNPNQLWRLIRDDLDEISKDA